MLGLVAGALVFWVGIAGRRVDGFELYTLGFQPLIIAALSLSSVSLLFRPLTFKRASLLVVPIIALFAVNVPWRERLMSAGIDTQGEFQAYVALVAINTIIMYVWVILLPLPSVFAPVVGRGWSAYLRNFDRTLAVLIGLFVTVIFAGTIVRSLGVSSPPDVFYAAFVFRNVVLSIYVYVCVRLGVYVALGMHFIGALRDPDSEPAADMDGFHLG